MNMKWRSALFLALLVSTFVSPGSLAIVRAEGCKIGPIAEPGFIAGEINTESGMLPSINGSIGVTYAWSTATAHDGAELVLDGKQVLKKAALWSQVGTDVVSLTSQPLDNSDLSSAFETITSVQGCLESGEIDHAATWLSSFFDKWAWQQDDAFGVGSSPLGCFAGAGLARSLGAFPLQAAGYLELSDGRIALMTYEENEYQSDRFAAFPAFAVWVFHLGGEAAVVDALFGNIHMIGLFPRGVPVQ